MVSSIFRNEFLGKNRHQRGRKDFWMYAICVMTYQKENILCNYYVLLSHIQELEVMKYQDDNNDAINHMSNLKNVRL